MALRINRGRRQATPREVRAFAINNARRSPGRVTSGPAQPNQFYQVTPRVNDPNRLTLTRDVMLPRAGILEPKLGRTPDGRFALFASRLDTGPMTANIARNLRRRRNL